MHQNRKERNNDCDDHVRFFNMAQCFVWSASETNFVIVEPFQVVHNHGIENDFYGD